MRKFQVIFETRKQSFISTFSICMTVHLTNALSWKSFTLILQHSKKGNECIELQKLYFISSCSQMFLKIGALKNFTGKHLCWSLFLIKPLLKRDSNTGVFLGKLRNF